MRKKRSSRHLRQKKKFSRNLNVKDAKDTEYLNWRRDQFFIVLIIFSRKKKSYEIYGKRREISKLKASILFLILVIFTRKNSYRREKNRFFSSSS